MRNNEYIWDPGQAESRPGGPGPGGGPGPSRDPGLAVDLGPAVDPGLVMDPGFSEAQKQTSAYLGVHDEVFNAPGTGVMGGHEYQHWCI